MKLVLWRLMGMGWYVYVWYSDLARGLRRVPTLCSPLLAVPNVAGSRTHSSRAGLRNQSSCTGLSDLRLDCDVANIWRDWRQNHRSYRQCDVICTRCSVTGVVLWSPYGIGRPYIFSSCFFFLSFFSSPNLSGRRLDVYHTFAHGVALVRI